MTTDYVSKKVAFDGRDILGNQLATQWLPDVNNSDEQLELFVEFKFCAESKTHFASIQRAIDQAIDNSSGKENKQRYVIKIGAGFFLGPVVIPPQAPPITLCGAGADCTIIAAAIDARMSGLEYASRFDHIIKNCNAITLARYSSITARQTINTLNSAVLSIARNDTIVSGLTIRNNYQCDRVSAAPAGELPDSEGRFANGQHQAVAVKVDAADRVKIIDCVLSSYQDTLYFYSHGLPVSRVNLTDCVIEGDVDFIFGGATAYFENCEVRTRGERSARSWATAPSTSLRMPFGFIFDDCYFSHDQHETGQHYQSFLGRQWFEAVRATPYGSPSATGFTCTYSDTNTYDGTKGTISRRTLESVGKCRIQKSKIGTHISTTKPWDGWSDQPGHHKYRPAQTTAGDFLENLHSWLALNGLDYSWLDPDELWLSIRL